MSFQYLLKMLYNIKYTISTILENYEFLLIAKLKSLGEGS